MLERVKVAEVALVYELWNEYAAAANEGDLERWIALWMEEGVQLSLGAPCRVGKAEIRKAMQRLFVLFKAGRMVIQPEEIRVLGNRAYSHGTYEFGIVPRKGGEATSYSGAFADVLEKQVDGSWKIAVDCRDYSTLPE